MSSLQAPAYPATVRPLRFECGFLRLVSVRRLSGRSSSGSELASCWRCGPAREPLDLCAEKESAFQMIATHCGTKSSYSPPRELGPHDGRAVDGGGVGVIAAVQRPNSALNRGLAKVRSLDFGWRNRLWRGASLPIYWSGMPNEIGPVLQTKVTWRTTDTSTVRVSSRREPPLSLV